MTDQDAETLAYYEKHASDFALQNQELELAPHYDRFLRHVRPGGRLLDAGCGPGRDALAFAQRGFSVAAFDASEAMVKLARSRLGALAAVYHECFAAIPWRDEFDGIWCSASLLHVPSSDFGRVAAVLVSALRRGGAWYLSFKLGEGERRVQGRLFADYSEATLRAATTPLNVELVDVWVSADLRPGRASERWLNAVALRRL